MSQLVEGLVKSGQRHSLMIIMTILMWESTTTAEILMGVLKESGATPLTQIRNGSTAMSKDAMQHTTVRRLALGLGNRHWVPAIQER